MTDRTIFRKLRGNVRDSCAVPDCVYNLETVAVSEQQSTCLQEQLYEDNSMYQ